MRGAFEGVGDALPDAALHDGRREGVQAQRNPRADEAFAAPIVGSRRAAACEHDAEPEYERAACDRPDREPVWLRGDPPEGRHELDEHRLDGDGDEECGEPPSGFAQPHVAERARDAKTAALKDEAQDGAEGETGQ